MLSHAAHCEVGEHASADMGATGDFNAPFFINRLLNVSTMSHQIELPSLHIVKRLRLLSKL